MAADWIKYTKELPQKPEVIRMSDYLGLKPRHVTGLLLDLWAWADANSTDGRIPGIKGDFIDERTGVRGFAAAMVKVGWLEVDDLGLKFSNFDRHNSETAKARALKARRNATYRARRSQGAAPPPDHLLLVSTAKALRGRARGAR